MTGDRPNSSPALLPVEGWTRRPAPPHIVLSGRYCRCEPLDAARHGDDLYQAFSATDPASWRYLFHEPPASEVEFRSWLAETVSGADPYYAVVDSVSGRAGGVWAYLRVEPAHGSIEIGSVHYADILKRTPVTTEATYLAMRHVFDELGYRRFEWKCNALNEPSRRAAARFGFQFEGVFRQHMVVKGHNRDTAWFSILDHEWLALRRAFEAWLSPDNFTPDGRQRDSLARLISAALRA